MVHLGVPCFTPGARIDTPSGPRPVENLLPGDRIVTRDSGTNIILWIGRKTLSWSDLRRNRHLAPVLLRAGSLGDDVPARDILVSPNHRILAETERSTLFHADPEVLVPAKHLVDNRNILEVDALGVTYHHFLFDRHEVVHSDGVWSESFQPADYTLSAVGNAQRAEILELFPDLRAPEGMVRFEDARRTLRWPDMRRWRD
ncbi:MAG: Hint domain-containing protein [Pseudomonadota bacterium]